ncbi:HAMP domain-containing sensor histidine kinase [Lachnobacterium bovis]|nr:HAMP domain-containing sensor histidine kinase [Lachnobacterium bovis]
MKNFFLFFVVVVCLIGITYFISTSIEGQIENQNVIEHTIQSVDYKIKNGNYQSIDMSKAIGKNGYFEILDEQGKCLYSSGEHKKNYSLNSIDFIPDVSMDTFVQLASTMKDNKKLLVISVYEAEYKDDGSYQGDKLKLMMVLDEKRNVIFSNANNIGKHKLSEREYNLLCTGYDKGTFLQKYIFTNKYGEKRYMILHVSRSHRVKARNMFYVYIITVAIMGLIFIGLLLSFSFSMRKNVERPINLISKAMKKVEKGESYDPVEYYGAQEFVDMCGAFNSMAQKLYRSEQERKFVEEQKQKMLADISHDLKTPITVIAGYTKALADGMVPKDKQRQYVEAINNKAELLSGLINSFYEYSKLEHPDYNIVVSNGDICEYLREYIAAKYNELEILGIEIQIDIPDTEVFADFDPTSLSRVFENIITNSIKHNKKGTCLYVCLYEMGDKIKIILADDGNGVPIHLKDTIFNPFVVGDESRNSKQGTGLGLSIAQKIVEQHQGTIELLEGLNDQWKTAFEIILPKKHDSNLSK